MKTRTDRRAHESFPGLGRGWLLLGTVLALWVAGAGVSSWAQHEGVMLTNDMAVVYQRVPLVEKQLYGHTYANQAISQRISRIERTLFGRRQSGPLEARMRGVEARMSEKEDREAQASQEPMLQYLEEKLFQRTFSERNLEERLRQLEAQVFGKTFDQYPVAVRMKKLTYAMPIMAKEIRVTRQAPGEGIRPDMVVASTARTSQRVPRNSGRPVDMVQLDARDAGSERVLPGGTAINTGDYFQSIHRAADGSLLRWANLPIKVYIKLSPESVMTGQMLNAWKKGFSVEEVSEPSLADVLLSWDRADWEKNPSGLLTRPVKHRDHRGQVRTVILVTMYPLRGQPPQHQQRVVSHQLGHAFGLWGHSDNPQDVMYPLLHWERQDFPSRWGWRSSRDRRPPLPNAHVERHAPSLRDLNTLLRVYDEAATDLAEFGLP